MSASFFAPLRIELLTITASEFRLADSPTDNMRASVDVTLDDEHALTDDNRNTLMQLLTVGISFSDTENVADERMSACITVRIVTTVGDTNETTEYQRASSLSIAYGHARSCINSIVSMSEMGGIMIPAINPQELLRQLDAKRDESANESVAD